MSYCRWGDDSDVYVYPHVAGGIHCCGCTLNNNTDEDRRRDRAAARKQRRSKEETA